MAILQKIIWGVKGFGLLINMFNKTYELGDAVGL